MIKLARGCAPKIAAASSPALRRLRAHLYRAHETAIYALKGETTMDTGERLEKRMHVRERDFVHFPANMPQRPFDPSLTETAAAIIARTDPNEQESVALLPDVEELKPL